MSTEEPIEPRLDVFPSAPIAPVSPFIFSGFLEHLGRCIYGGILPAGPTNFPYTAHRPCPPEQFVETPQELLTPEGFRRDVLAVLRDELRTPMVRWPGGNFVSSYRWEDGIGPREERKRRPQLAWGGEESNLFGTDEFIEWCRVGKIEPYIVLDMGTGTLEDALHWVEYCNGKGDTYYANLRRKNTGRDEPHNVKYWGLGNEVWGEWQVGQQTAAAYAAKARQWAHAIRLVDPSVKLVGCGETGLNRWDSVVLDELVDKVDLHSIHLYTGFGPRDRSQKEKEYGRTVYGPDAAEYSIEVCKGLINKARFAKNVSKPIKIAFDEYGVWDETIGTPENGLEQFYTLADALAMASWLNVFVRQADIVDIACIAQSVNVISPLMTSPAGLFKQTIYYPLYLFSHYMRDGVSVRVSLTSPTFAGRHCRRGYPASRAAPRISMLPRSCTLRRLARSLRVAVVNRSELCSYQVPVRIAFERAAAEVEVHELWHENVCARNGHVPTLLTSSVLESAESLSASFTDNDDDNDANAPSYSPCPRPILKRNSASLSDPQPRDESTQLLAIDPSILSSLVHFPPSPILASTLGSAPTYDRSPIVVSPNRCTLPARGCPGRTYSLDDPLPTRQQSPPRTGRTVHPRALHNESMSWPTAPAEPLSLPALIPDLSSESSEESDGFISAAPSASLPCCQCLTRSASALHCPRALLSRSSRTRPHRATPIPARTPLLVRAPRAPRPPARRIHDGGPAPAPETAGAPARSRIGKERRTSVLHECSLTVPDLGCLGGF
ncbi:putative alpha-L-arabinofuranosidase C [Grifola frondosa]|uniref:non-reducing end alpha-L-arabinofuranosidase n=1 Tax=Grifola frondosa TaxID=5627 RepID=A0A1C7LRX8_GRIFR|nr:putative alpha-L-arabinofuranosidase C [Grifola frondosa]